MQIVYWNEITKRQEQRAPTPAELAQAAIDAAEAARPVVPQSVTMRQARLALLGAGLLPSVNAAISGMAGPTGDAARIEWEYSGEVQRNRELVAALGPALGLSDAQLDELFIAASAL